MGNGERTRNKSRTSTKRSEHGAFARMEFSCFRFVFVRDAFSRSIPAQLCRNSTVAIFPSCIIRRAFHVRVSANGKVVPAHFSVTISMNAFPSAGQVPACGNAAGSATFPRVLTIPMQQALRTTLNLWRQWKCLATTKRIPWFRRRVSACMKRDFSFRGNAPWNACMESRPKAGFLWNTWAAAVWTWLSYLQFLS